METSDAYVKHVIFLYLGDANYVPDIGRRALHRSNEWYRSIILTQDVKRHPTIMCLILTSEKSKQKRDAVNATWTKRCDGRYYVMGLRKYDVINY